MTVRRLPMGSASAAPVTDGPGPQPIGIVLGDQPLGPLVAAPWAGSLIALGARLARQIPSLSDGQLVVALTVPVRDLAAVLVACGWTLTRPAKELGIPADVAATVAYGTPVRMVTDHYVIGGPFYGIQDGPTGPRIRAYGNWELSMSAASWPFQISARTATASGTLLCPAPSRARLGNRRRGPRVNATHDATSRFWAPSCGWATT